jgi:hypothetical protein
MLAFCFLCHVRAKLAAAEGGPTEINQEGMGNLALPRDRRLPAFAELAASAGPTVGITGGDGWT